MKNLIKAKIILLTLLLLFTSCSNDNGGNDNPNDNTDEIPHFVRVDYIELDMINKISRFRSAAGHDYSDDFEDCRSMKHYFWPEGGDPGEPHPAWAEIKIYSPVKGVITNFFEEWAGTQIQINSTDYPDFFFIIFHVNLTGTFRIGDTLEAGQQLGTHIGSQTMSDVAVGVNTDDGWKLVSYFEVMIDSVFESYQSRGLISRDELIITAEERDANPLTCDGDVFTTAGNLADWVILD